MSQQYGYPPGQPPPPGHPPQHYGAPQQPYGAPPYGAQPPGYMPPQQDPRMRDLNDQSNTWLIVAIVGFWLGFGFITGPLAWVKGGRIRAEYRSLGMPPSGSATGAWIIGIVCTALYGLILISVLSCVILAAGAAATSGV